VPDTQTPKLTHSFETTKSKWLLLAEKISACHLLEYTIIIVFKKSEYEMPTCCFQKYNILAIHIPSLQPLG
jgi:hypothetical protein